MSIRDPNLIESAVAELRNNWRSLPTDDLSWRRAQLRALQQMVVNHRDELIAAENKDLGKDYFQSYFIELNLVEREIQEALDSLEEWTANVPVSGDLVNLPSLQHMHPEPLGVVFIAGAWNFPIQLTLAPLVAAIAAGNCCLVKTPSLLYSRHTTDLLEKLAEQYLDSRYIKFCGGNEEMIVACINTRVEKIFFTGGCGMGTRVAKAAAEHLTPCVLELGGKSPVVVDDSADLGVAAKRIIWAAFMNSGQMCIRPDYMFVDKKIAKKFLAVMKATVEEFWGLDASQSPHFGRMINERAFNNAVQRLQSDISQGNCDIVTGGDWIASGERFIAPTILDFGSNKKAFLESAAMSCEQFAPVLPVYHYDTLDEAIDYIADQCHGGNKPLMCHIFTTRSYVWKRFEKETQSGMFNVNETVTHAGNTSLPFGGIGKSGMGSYHGKFGFDTFSHFKSVLIKTNYLDLPQRYPPYSTASIGILTLVQWVYPQSQIRMIKFGLLSILTWLLLFQIENPLQTFLFNTIEKYISIDLVNQWPVAHNLFTQPQVLIYFLVLLVAMFICLNETYQRRHFRFIWISSCTMLICWYYIVSYTVDYKLKQYHGDMDITAGASRSVGGGGGQTATGSGKNLFDDAYIDVSIPEHWMFTQSLLNWVSVAVLWISNSNPSYVLLGMFGAMSSAFALCVPNRLHDNTPLEKDHPMLSVIASLLSTLIVFLLPGNLHDTDTFGLLLKCLHFTLFVPSLCSILGLKTKFARFKVASETIYSVMGLLIATLHLGHGMTYFPVTKLPSSP
eukprot:g3192.t1